MQCLPIIPLSYARRVLIALLAPGLLAAQTASPDPGQTDLGQIVQRLDRLEKQNQSLAEEIRQLRQELAEARGQPQPSTFSPWTGLALLCVYAVVLLDLGGVLLVKGDA